MHLVNISVDTIINSEIKPWISQHNYEIILPVYFSFFFVTLRVLLKY